MISKFDTVDNNLSYQARKNPHQLAFKIEDIHHQANITYESLNQRVEGLSQYFNKHYSRQAVIGLIFNCDRLDFIIAFLSCLRSGMIATPIAAPHPAPHRLRKDIENIHQILKKAQPSIIITESNTIKECLAVENCILFNEIPSTSVAGAQTQHLKPEDIAFLQFTSGTTGPPKGVMIGHSQICANLDAMIMRMHDLNKPPLTIHHTVNWMPWYHDMGLISGILLPLRLLITGVLIPPKTFIKSPLFWLKTISHHPNALSGGPNFAYALCHKRALHQTNLSLDLSTWRLAFAGAQMVFESTFNQFSTTFSPVGFNPNIFYPCYGLAESTLYVTGACHMQEPQFKHQAQSPNHEKLCSVGSQLPNHEIIIVNPSTKETQGEKVLGEIWIKGPSVARGYYQEPELSQDTFNAHTLENNGPYLRSGDLGILDCGDLYILGRIKDTIKINARNHSCPTLELCAQESHEKIRPMSCAAFSVIQNHRETCMIAAEIRLVDIKYSQEIIRAIKSALSKTHGISVNTVFLMPPKSIEKTTSGKIKRHLLQERYYANSLNILIKG